MWTIATMVSPSTGFTTRRTLPAIVRAPIDARTWRAVVYLLVAAPLSLAALVVLAVGAWVGLVLSVTVVGIPLLSGLVLGARYYGYAPRALARALLGEDVTPPPRRRPQTPGLLPWLRASLGDLDGWRAIAFVVVSFPVAVTGAAATALSAYLALAMLTYPLYWQLGDPVNVGPDGTEHDSAMQFGDFYVETWPRAITVSLVGVVAVLAAPWVSRAFAALHGLLVRGLLGPTRIAARVADLEATRARAVDDSAATLRRPAWWRWRCTSTWPPRSWPTTPAARAWPGRDRCSTPLTATPPRPSPSCAT